MSARRVYLPVTVVCLLLVLLAAGLRLKPSVLPSALVGRSAPAFRLPSLHDETRAVSTDELQGAVTLINVWASWCLSCRREHAFLSALTRQEGVRIIGLNYKDRPEDARRWLAYYGDPYQTVALDRDGAVGMEYGVYGVPETYLIDHTGIVRHRHVGPLNEQAWREEILPKWRRLTQARG